MTFRQTNTASDSHEPGREETTGTVTAWRRRMRSKVFSPLFMPQQANRRSQLASLPMPPGKVVFLGDSITEFGEWHEWFPDIPLANRGVGGETSAEILDRVDGVINAPKAVMLLMGTNDLGTGRSTDGIVANLREVLDRIESCAPGTPVVVQSIMPRASEYRDDVRRANRGIQQVVAEYPERIRYLDLWTALAAADGALRPELSEDGLHLNGAGYREWVAVLGPVLRETVTGR